MMLEPSMLVLFVAAALAILVTPGPAVLYIVARGVDQGRRAGLASVLGIEVGSLFHIAAAALGVSALLLSSALAFNVVRYAGAIYLIYLGIKRLLDKEEEENPAAPRAKRMKSIFGQGVLLSVFNPKEAVFFFAFLPQFIDPSKGQIPQQVLSLGVVWLFLATCSDCFYALLAGWAGQWLRGNLTFLRSQRYVTGGVFLALGIGAGLSGSNSK